MDREVDIYTKRVRAERESQTQPDDAAADAVRVAAPDARAALTGQLSRAPSR
jgi:glycerol-3-phosphate dehydrogenase